MPMSMEHIFVPYCSLSSIRYMRKLIEAGYVYIAQPPLFKIERNKVIRYAMNDKNVMRLLLNLVRMRNLTFNVIKGWVK